MLMEKMYTQDDVVRYVAKERDRNVTITFEKQEELKRLKRQKRGILARINYAIDVAGEIMLSIFGRKDVSADDYQKQLLEIVKQDYFGNGPKVEKIDLDGTVFPSKEKTIQVINDATYGGAHCYIIRECLGFKDGKTSYVDSKQVIQFIQKLDDGTVIPGLQSEQLVLMLIDRHKKLNARFPSAQNEKMIQGLEMFLDASRERVEDRMNRGVMGDLKK
jgi:hypothetical protein